MYFTCLVLYTWSILIQENECRISIHDRIEENVILQIRLAALDFQRANESITLEMLLDEKVGHSFVLQLSRRTFSSSSS